jgi:hypothetical protein
VNVKRAIDARRDSASYRHGVCISAVKDNKVKMREMSVIFMLNGDRENEKINKVDESFFSSFFIIIKRCQR